MLFNKVKLSLVLVSLRISFYVKTVADDFYGWMNKVEKLISEIAELHNRLKEIGVKDSKKLLNPDIVKLAKEIMEEFPKKYHIENIYPAEYNKLNLKLNVTKILDKLHDKCFKKLKCKSTLLHIVDLYPGCDVGNIKKKNARESLFLR